MTGTRTAFGLLDANSFYCNCERLFRPDLLNRPLCVLAGHDGPMVSMTKELKQLGIKIGTPYFKHQQLFKKMGVVAFSPNFSLYATLSKRLMTVLESLVNEIEIYSVDEAFFKIRYKDSRDAWLKGRQIKAIIEKRIGVPVSLGIGPSKTLAKLGSHLSKKLDSAQGVYSLIDLKARQEIFPQIKVDSVWGIGSASTKKLNQIGIQRIDQLVRFSNLGVLKKMGGRGLIVTLKELQGESSLHLEAKDVAHKEIMCSRSFVSDDYDETRIRERLAQFTAQAAEKLRAQKQYCSQLEVFLCTNRFSQGPQYFGQAYQKLLCPTQDTRKLTRAAMQAFKDCFQMGYGYKKIGVRLVKLIPTGEYNLNFLEPFDCHQTVVLHQLMDLVNSRDGRRTLYWGSAGTRTDAFKLRARHKSPRYMQGWSELPVVKC